MSHLSRHYLDYFYVERGRGEKKQLVKVRYLKNREFASTNNLAHLDAPIFKANGIFPYSHDRRDFLPQKGKKHNRTKARMKRRNKARLKKRN